VESAFVRLTPRAKPQVPAQLQAAFDELVVQAFAMRRKTLRNSLRGLLPAEALESAGVNPGDRPERLSLDDFAELARTLVERRADR
jgi:16S rRNA (adenine1518-N6/adenine1519-N6)-dimethyltransferase